MDANEFWQMFLAQYPDMDGRTPFQVWYFGNSSEMAADLAALVIAGKKTATASLRDIDLLKPDTAAVDGGYSVVTNFEGEPLCVIQTTKIRHVPFDEVDAAFAYDEGEGDRSLEFWRRAHREYFSREAAAHNIEFSGRSIICCEHFRLLYPTPFSE